MVASKVAHLSFDAAFFMAGGRIAKLTGKAPMRAEGNKPGRFLAPLATQHFLDSAFQVVVTQTMKHTAEVVKGLLMGFEKNLLRGIGVSPMKSRPAGHTAQAEDLQGGALAVQDRHRFVPVHLCFAAPGIALRHTRVPS